MSDLEKLEALLPKLVHFLPDVRLRTSNSLLFKLESGLLKSVLTYNSTYVQMIVKSITESIRLLTSGNNTWKTSSSIEALTLQSLFSCVVQISNHDLGNATASAESTANFSRLLEMLFLVQSFGVVEGNARVNLEAAIAGLGRIHSPTGQGQGQGQGQAQSTDSNALVHSLTSAGGAASSTAEALRMEQAVELEAAGSPAGMSSSRRGAGAVLHSTLCSQGWHFSKVLLTDIDEKFLFDVEVKVKMGHEDVTDALWDVLTDFPAGSIMDHPGLIRAVLDVVGSNSSLSSTGTGAAIGLTSKCLDSIGAMNWLRQLVIAAVRTYENQLEGSLCSVSIPEVDANGADGSSSASAPKPAATLATNMTHAIQRLRVPHVCIVEDDNSGRGIVYGESCVRSAAAMAHITAPGLCPAPSLPGLAFAACAASLPLLQSTDSATLAAVVALLAASLPYVKEPVPLALEQGGSASASSNTTKGADRLRLQHVLNRIERILTMRGGTPPSIHTIAQMSAYDESADNATSEWLTAGAGDAAIFRCVLDVLRLLPPTSLARIYGSSSGSGREGASAAAGAEALLTMGPLTLASVRHICMFAGSLSSSFASERDLVCAWACLSHVDGASYDALRSCQQLLAKALELPGILKNDAAYSEYHVMNQLHDALTVAVNLLYVGNMSYENHVERLAIVPAVLSLLTRGLAVELGPAGVSMATAVLCSKSMGAKCALITYLLQIVNANPTVVRALTSSSAFLLSLVLLCVYDNSNDSDSESQHSNASAAKAAAAAAHSAALSPAATKLLLVLLGSSVTKGTFRQLYAECPSKWAALLAPLKALEWGMESITSHAHVPTAITSFAGHLEDLCSRSPAGSAARAAFEKTITLGLFHADGRVRAASAARVRNELERYFSSSSSYRAAGAVPASMLEVDPFGEGNNFIFCAPWAVLHSAQKGTSLPATAAAALASDSGTGDSYSGAMKLASIAFGEQSAHIRAAALRQLRNSLLESKVLATAEGSWLVHLASQASTVIGRVYTYLNQPVSGAAKVTEVSDLRLAQEAAALLRLLLARCRCVRAAARILQTTDVTAAGRSESAQFSLLPAVTVALRLFSAHITNISSSSNSASVAGGSAAFYEETRLLCAQCLSLAAACDLFASPSPSPSSSSASDDVLFNLRSSPLPFSVTSGATITIPSVMANVLLLPVSLEDLSQRTVDYEEALVECSIYVQTNAPIALAIIEHASSPVRGDASNARGNFNMLANAEYLTELMAISVSRNNTANTLYASIAAVVCKAVALSVTHEELRAIVSAASCLTITMPGVAGHYGAEKLNDALSRLLRTAPQTNKDMMTLTSVLHFLTTLVTKVQDNSLKPLYDDLLSAAVLPLFPYLVGVGLSNGSSSSGRPPLPSQVKEYQTYLNKDAIRWQLLHALNALAHVPSKVFSGWQALQHAGGSDRNHHPLLSLLVTLAAQEGGSSYKQTLASNTVFSLMTNHNIFSPAGGADDAESGSKVSKGQTSFDGKKKTGAGGADAGAGAEVSFDGLFSFYSSSIYGSSSSGSAGIALLRLSSNASAASLSTEVNIVQQTVKTAKLLRKPDSVQGFGPLVASLKMLLAMTKSASKLSQAKGGCQVNTDSNGQNWRWLIRLFFDRRTEVRLLAVEIYYLLQSIDRYFHAALNAGDSSEQEAFPLSKYLHSVAFDDTEALAVRNAVFRVLLLQGNNSSVSASSSSAVISPSAQSSPLQDDEGLVLGQIIVSLQSQISLQRHPLVAPATLSAAVGLLITAVTSPTYGEKARACVRRLQLAPQVLALASSDVYSSLEKLSFRRVGVDVLNLSLTGASSWLDRDRNRLAALAAAPPANRSGSSSSSSIIPSYNSGWEDVWQKHFNGTGRVALNLTVCAACRLTQILAGRDERSVLGATFTSPTRSIVSCMGLDSFKTPAAAGYDSPVLKEAEGRALAALADLLSDMALRAKSTPASASDDWTSDMFAALKNALPRLLSSTTQSGGAGAGAGVNQQHAAVWNSVLRLVCIGLEHSRASASIDTRSLLECLMQLRSTLNSSSSGGNSPSSGGLHACIDVTLCLLLQRAPTLSLPTETMQTCMAAIVRGARVLKEGTDKAMEARSAANSAATRKGAAGTSAVRTEVWSAMMLLQSAMGSVCCDREETTALVESSGLHHALGLLLECTEVWALVEDSSHTTPALTSLQAFIAAASGASQSGGGWTPSFTQVSIACLALSCALCRDNIAGKRLLLISRDMGTQDGAGAVWNCVVSIANLSTSRKISGTLRLAALNLLTSMISCTYSVSQSFVQRSKSTVKYAKDAVVNALNVVLQQQKGKAAPEYVALLLDAIGVCFIAECCGATAGGGLQSSSAVNNSVLLPTRLEGEGAQDGFSPSSRVAASSKFALASRVARENRQMQDSTTIPTLLHWVWESYKHSAVVMTALVRLIGKLSSVLADVPSSSTHARKLCIAAASSEEALRIVTDATADRHATVANTAMLALWATTHSSEQARANVKRLLMINGTGGGLTSMTDDSGGGGGGGSFPDTATTAAGSSRAAYALHILLE